MSSVKTVGLPRMMKEQGEKRVFLPEFVAYLTTLGVQVFVEQGYGSSSGYAFAAYQQNSERVIQCSREEAFAQDLVLVLRSPEDHEFDLLQPDSCLISMLHFPSRPQRVHRLQELGIKAISLDSIVDSRNIRLVENMKAVAWNGIEAAFDVLEGFWTELQRPNDELIKVLVLGIGMVGKHAVEAVTKMGNIERNNQHILEGITGSIAWTAGRNVSLSEHQMTTMMSQVDILVNSTQRRQLHTPIVPNHWLSHLPNHAVIVDLAVDPYLLDGLPPTVRGIEGIPKGNLDQYIFAPDDPLWDKTVP